jgi:hypothetical protein
MENADSLTAMDRKYKTIRVMLYSMPRIIYCFLVLAVNDPQGPAPLTQNLVSGMYPETVQFTTYFTNTHLILISVLFLGLPSSHFPRGFPTQDIISISYFII